jgi:hypothetical protein
MDKQLIHNHLTNCSFHLPKLLIHSTKHLFRQHPYQGSKARQHSSTIATSGRQLPLEMSLIAAAFFAILSFPQKKV